MRLVVDMGLNLSKVSLGSILEKRVSCSCQPIQNQLFNLITLVELQFIDESSDLANYYGHYSAPTISHHEQNLPRSRSSSLSSSSFCTDSRSETGTRTREGSPKASPSNLLTAPEKVPEEFSHNNVVRTLVPDHIIAKDGIEISPNQSGTWPSANFQEAFLMKYFVEELSQWVNTELINHSCAKNI